MVTAVSEPQRCTCRQIKSKKTGLVFGHSKNGSFIERVCTSRRDDGFRFSADYQQIVIFKKCRSY
jgi:hypothetical protein